MQIILFYFILIFTQTGKCSDFKQERAKVTYFNPKYVKNVSTLTFREKRNSPYLTSINITLLATFANNVTWQLDFYTVKLAEFPLRYEARTCDGFKEAWLKEWLYNYSNGTIHGCPVTPGTYHIRKFEIPPKNFPLKFNDVDYFVKFVCFLTLTKEKLVELTLDMKFSNKKSKIK